MFSGFQWFPKKWGKRKVSEQFHQSKFADEGKGILITIYAIDLYFISIPLKVKNIISFNHKYILYLKVGVVPHHHQLKNSQLPQNEKMSSLL
ncbi:hypothetical protein [Bacillus cereus]|uniref:hypothetical protein n=2 Tax=Bacillaceae TaxID=186817 RepID=UPI003B5BDABB